MAFARLLQLAALRETDRVLDVGCGTGYSTAVLARLAASVTALECDEDLAAKAQETSAKPGHLERRGGLRSSRGRFTRPWPVRRHRDQWAHRGRCRKHCSGSLREAGRLVAVVGETAVARAILHTLADGVVGVRAAFDASVAPLPGFRPGEAGLCFLAVLVKFAYRWAALAMTAKGPRDIFRARGMVVKSKLLREACSNETVRR